MDVSVGFAAARGNVSAGGEKAEGKRKKAEVVCLLQD
jgi:hypothetical protein